MKKLFFTVIIAITGWCMVQAQSKPAPDKFNSFIEQIAQQDPANALILMSATMETLSSDPASYRQMLELAERRFSDPADPIHNEALYMVVLEHATEKFVLSAAEREKQRLLLEGAKKNKIGSVATDFDYVTPTSNEVHHLKDLKADNILIYFNNPDCESCELVKERLATNEYINQLVKDKKLIVLAIYPYDDQKLWKKAKYPGMMINGWNQSRSIEFNELYDLPTLPCFYLLDKDYKVLVKNEGSLNKVEAMLKQPNTAQAASQMPDIQTRKVNQKEAAKPKQEEVAPIPAAADDPNAINSEQIMEYLINNQGQEIYDNMSEKIKSRIKPTIFENALAEIETKMGKYKSHEAWEIRRIQGVKSYTSLMHFEKGALYLVIMYDMGGKMVNMRMVTPETILK